MLIIVNRGREPQPTTFTAMRNYTIQRTDHDMDQFWIVEHPSVFTLGLRADLKHLRINPGNLPVIPTDRGGEITYHGPGQAIIYLLLDLRRFKKQGIRELVHTLEQGVIDVLAHYQLCGKRLPSMPGVYVTHPVWQNAKIAALGLKVHCNRCTYHGIALNVAMDLTPFSWINPCGNADLRTVDMKTLGVNVPLQEVQSALAQQLHHLLKQLTYTES